MIHGVLEVHRGPLAALVLIDRVKYARAVHSNDGCSSLPHSLCLLKTRVRLLVIIGLWLDQLRLLRRQHQILTLVDSLFGRGSDICYVWVPLANGWAVVDNIVFYEYFLAGDLGRGDGVIVHNGRRHLAVPWQLAQQLLLQLLVVSVVIVLGRHDFA